MDGIKAILCSLPKIIKQLFVFACICKHGFKKKIYSEEIR